MSVVIDQIGECPFEAKARTNAQKSTVEFEFYNPRIGKYDNFYKSFNGWVCTSPHIFGIGREDFRNIAILHEELDVVTYYQRSVPLGIQYGLDPGKLMILEVKFECVECLTFEEFEGRY